MKRTFHVVVVALAALAFAPAALAEVGDAVSGAGSTASGVAFSILAIGGDGGTATGTAQLRVEDFELTAAIQCLFVHEDSAVILGLVSSTTGIISGGVMAGFVVTDGDPDQFGWRLVPLRSCAEWANAPPTESVALASQLVSGDIRVHEGTATDRLAALITDVQTGTGTGSSLLAKLQSAAASMDDGNLEAACNKLAAFAAEVRAQSGKKLTTAEASALLAAVAATREAAGCG